jgi:phospholipid transport system substrate-binding protein
MKRKTGGVILIFFLVFPIGAYAGAPFDTIRTHVDSMLDVLRDPALKGESVRETRKDKIRAISEKMFNFEALSKRTLGKNWKKLNAGQQKEFVELYKDMLEKAYIDRILDYSDEKVVYQKEIMLSENKAEVRTTIVAKTGDIPMNYRLILKAGKWGVYDIVVEGVSLIKNYRSQFREIIAKKSLEDLLATMRDKVGKG